MIPIAMVAIICWAGIIKNRDNNAFKQSMLDRGMSAQEIEQVASARIKAGFFKKHRYSLVRVCIILLLLFLVYDLTNDIDNDISVSILANHPNFMAFYNTSTYYHSDQCVPVVADGIQKATITARGVKGIRIDPEVGGQLYPSFSSVTMRRIFILNDLYVGPSARKKGIAGALLNQSEVYAAEMGAARLALATEITNTAAQKLYEKLQWKKDEVFFHYNKAVKA